MKQLARRSGRTQPRLDRARFASTCARQELTSPTPLPAWVSTRTRPPCPPSSDTRWPSVGHRVIAATRFGGQAELAVSRAADCLPLPDDMSFEEGAAVLVSYGTAWAGAMIMGGLRPGETLLVQSAGGGVGIAAIQVGAFAGAEVIATASPVKHAAVLANGATHVFDYHDRDVTSEILRITEGRGVDVILDPLGPTYFRQDYRLLRPGGRLIMFGMSEVMSGERRNMRRALSALARLPFSTHPWWKSANVFNENKGVFGLNMLTWWDREQDLSRVIRPVEEGLMKGAFRPLVAEAFPFSRAGEAHRCLQKASNVGKVVLVPD
jgi:NADPH:quinone reductase-like Zn-dependent oxidoreductase